MAILSKPKAALRQIMESLGRLDLFERIVKAEGRKQRHSTVIYAFKSLASELPKTDTATVRQLAQLVAQVEDEELRLQLETVMQELFTPTKQKGSPFYDVEPVTAKPFDFGILHKQKSNGGLFQRMFRKGKSK